jgi:hypothetical protein
LDCTDGCGVGGGGVVVQVKHTVTGGCCGVGGSDGVGPLVGGVGVGVGPGPDVGVGAGLNSGCNDGRARGVAVGNEMS